MTVSINGEDRDVALGTTVADFLAERGMKPQMVVVEYNRDILQREQYDATTIKAGDTLEIVQMMAGG